MENDGPTYHDFLRLDILLGLQGGWASHPDAHFFFTAHQACELQFKIILYELDATVAALSKDDVDRAIHCLRRVRALEDAATVQVGTLETIDPGSFAKLRIELAEASGLQSIQFREIEFISGRKDPGFLRIRAGTAERERLRRRMSEPTLWEEFVALLARRGEPDLAPLYRSGTQHELVRLADALLGHDEGFALWRSRHVLMVERMIGPSPGTGGSSGARYLRSTLGIKFFPELWDLRAGL